MLPSFPFPPEGHIQRTRATTVHLSAQQETPVVAQVLILALGVEVVAHRALLVIQN